MKKIIYLLTLALAILGKGYAQGPVVFLPLDNSLNDYSGNGLHATDAGSEATTFVSDAERGSVAFFAEAAHAQLPVDAKLNFGTGDFSVAFWIKIDNAPGSDPAILSNKDWGSGGNPGFLIALDGADDPANQHMWTSNIADGTARLDWDADDNATPNLVDGTWHFVVVSYDRDATMNVYFDGILKQSDPEADSKDMTLVPGDISGHGLPITIMQDGTGAYGADFAAFLDEIYIYDRVLEPSEVSDLKSFGLNPAQDVVLGADVYLPFDGNLNDASGNDLHATDAGTTPTGFVDDPERGMVGHFPVDAHAQLPLDPALDISTGDFSVAFWIKVDVAPESDPAILSNKDWGSGGNPGFLIALDGANDPDNQHMWTSNIADGTARLDWDADDNQTPNLVDATWHHVAVTYDRDATMNVYFDGILKQSDPEADSKDMTLVPGDIGAGNLPITIMQDGTGAYGADFEAYIDEVRVWNGEVLTAEKVVQAMNAKAGVDQSYDADVYLPLDTDLNDASGNSLHATDAGSEATVFETDPERGQVAKFPLAAHAQLPVDPKLNLGTEDFSVAFWIKVDDTNPPESDPSILSNKDWGSGGNPGFLIALDGANDPANQHMWTSNIADGTSRLDWDADDNQTPNLVDGNWHFVVVTYDRDATMNVYFDGDLKQTDPEADSKDMTLVPGDMSAHGLPITIMQDGTGTYGADFEAWMDDVRIWVGTVVSPTEVFNMFKYQEAVPESDQAYGADVYLPLDEDLKDQSGNGVDAMSAGTEEIKFVEDTQRGLVAEFPSAAHAQFPDHSLLDFGTDDFTVSFWVKISADVLVPSDPVILGNKDWGSGGNPGFQIGLDGADDAAAHLWTVNVADGTGRLDWDADDNQTPNLKDGNWHFVAVAFDRDATMNVYLDGILRQTDPEADSKDMTLIPGDLNAAGLPLTIMQDGTGAYPADFEARIDDIRIWKGKVLTANEVSEIFSPEDKPYESIVFLPLNNNLFDFSGNNLHAADKGTEETKFVKDTKRGDVAEFPIAAHAQFPIDPRLDFGTEDFSVAFWIRINPNIDIPGDPVILGNKDWGSGGNPGFQIGLDGADDPSAHLWTVNAADGTGRLDWDADDNQTPNLKDGEWHLVAVAFDRDATMNVYFDGELRQTDVEQDSKDMTLMPASISAAGLPLTIMQDGTGAYGNDFSALLDNIRVWDRVITDAEVSEIFSEDKGSNIGDGETGIVLSIDDPKTPHENAFTTYPNPVRGNISKISFFLESPANIKLSVYDIMGNLVKTMINEPMSGGNHTIEWDTTHQPKGMYFYRIESNHFNRTLRVILNR
ncbi:T9SS type A sorting domain-containing protein [Fulvivirgaceae bacterium BMA12]|uniref:T9SS type A sorting domain-containing protein n=1 Tax=Agaribacillus aureus TaxID=3051825 RepID=A0ABT8L2E3_9BACT|nr:T9SS type A sorting domain-containing protein [Fulvivirgaceae bacterium BMA12]